MINDGIIIIDPRKKRREAIGACLSRFGLAVEQLPSVKDLPAYVQCSGIFLAADEGETIDQLMDYLAASQLPSAVVAIAEEPQVQSIVKAIKSGVTDYLSWPTPETSLMPAILAAGRQIAPRDDGDPAQLIARQRVSILTKRELEVISAVSMGKTSREIAQSIGISPRTVEIHRANAQKKLGARNSSEAVRVLRDGTSRAGH